MHRDTLQWVRPTAVNNYNDDTCLDFFQYHVEVAALDTMIAIQPSTLVPQVG